MLYTVNWHCNWHLFPHFLRKTSRLLVPLRASPDPSDLMFNNLNSSLYSSIIMLASKDILLTDNLYSNKILVIQLFWHHTAYFIWACGYLSSSVALEEWEGWAQSERQAAKSRIRPHPWSWYDPNVNSELSPVRLLWELFMEIQKGTQGKWRLRRQKHLPDNIHLRMIINHEMSNWQRLPKLRHTFSLYFGFWYSDNIFSAQHSLLFLFFFIFKILIQLCERHSSQDWSFSVVLSV